MIPKNRPRAEDKRHAVADHAVAQLKKTQRLFVIERRGTDGEAAVNLSRMEGIPDTPPRLPFFKPRPPQPGLIYYLRRLSVSTGHKFAERRRQVVS